MVKMGLTHDSIIKREQEKYGPDWLTFRELTYDGYRFDLFAFNPKTKEIEIVEVDLSSASCEQKLERAKTLGKLRVFRNFGEKIVPKRFQMTLKAISNVTRLTMLEFLYTEGKMRYTDIALRMKVDLSKEAGRFTYHLKQLLSSGLIGADKEGYYVISAKGAQIVDFCRELAKEH